MIERYKDCNLLTKIYRRANYFPSFIGEFIYHLWNFAIGGFRISEPERTVFKSRIGYLNHLYTISLSFYHYRMNSYRSAREIIEELKEKTNV